MDKIVCLFVCLLATLQKTYNVIFMKFSGKVTQDKNNLQILGIPY